MMPAVAIVEQYPVLLDDINKMIVEYQALAVVPGDIASYKEARAACTTLVHTRTAIEAKRKDLLRDYRDNVNQVADALLAPLTPVETRLKAELKAEDDRKAAIKAELEAIEKKRVDAIKASIFKLVNYANAQGKTAEQISKRIEAIESYIIGEETYREFVADAILAKATTLKTLRDALAEREQVEKEEAAHKAEAERLERIQIEQEVAQKKLDDERATLEAKAKADQEALAEEHRKIDEEKAKIEADKQAEKDRIAALEAEKIEKEKAEIIAKTPLDLKWLHGAPSRKETELTEDPILSSLKKDQKALAFYFNQLVAVPIPDIKNDALEGIFLKFLKDLNSIMEIIRDFQI